MKTFHQSILSSIFWASRTSASLWKVFRVFPVHEWPNVLIVRVYIILRRVRCSPTIRTGGFAHIGRMNALEAIEVPHGPQPKRLRHTHVRLKHRASPIRVRALKTNLCGLWHPRQEAKTVLGFCRRCRLNWWTHFRRAYVWQFLSCKNHGALVGYGTKFFRIYKDKYLAVKYIHGFQSSWFWNNSEIEQNKSVIKFELMLKFHVFFFWSSCQESHNRCMYDFDFEIIHLVYYFTSVHI